MTPLPLWRRARFCGLCFKKLNDIPNDPLARSKDHIIPTALGGPNMEWNYRALCRACNSSRDNEIIANDTQALVSNMRRIRTLSHHTDAELRDMAEEIIDGYLEWAEAKEWASFLTDDDIPLVVVRTRTGQFDWWSWSYA